MTSSEFGASLMLRRPAGRLQGCLKAMQVGGSAVYEQLQEVKGDMIKAGLKFNKRTHALFVEVHLTEGNTEVCTPVKCCSSICF